MLSMVLPGRVTTINVAVAFVYSRPESTYESFSFATAPSSVQVLLRSTLEIMLHLANIFSRNPQQSLAITFPIQNGAIFSLEFSPMGDYLAAGGETGLQVFKLSTKQLVDLSFLPQPLKRNVTSLAWFTPPRSMRQFLCFANVEGCVALLELTAAETCTPQLVTWETIGSQGNEDPEVTCIAVDSVGPEVFLAAGTRDSRLVSWAVNLNTGKLTLIASKRQKTVIGDSFPKALTFDKGSILMFGVYDGLLRRIRVSDFKTVSRTQLKSSIGNAVVNHESQLCVIDNVSEGFDIYNIVDGGHVRSLTTRPVNITSAKVVKFFDGSRLVVGGSDHGLVYIFNTSTGKVLDTLQHNSHEPSEIVAVHDVHPSSAVIASSSSTSAENSIKVWYFQKRRPTVSTFLARIACLTALVVVVAAYMFISFYYTVHGVSQDEAVRRQL